jgi:hypothetical protein
MTRRWLLKTTATALVGLSVVGVLPASALPRSGAFGEAVKDNAIARLKRVYDASVASGRRPLVMTVGTAIGYQYEAELVACERLVPDNSDYATTEYRFKGARVRPDVKMSPWAVTVTEAKVM